jgi:hypothetical protein
VPFSEMPGNTQRRSVTSPNTWWAMKEKQFMRVVSVGLFRTAEVRGHTLRGDGRPLLFREAVVCLPPAAGAEQSAAC